MQSYNNLLSIIIPCYNEEKSLKVYLPEVIAFCREHSFKLIVINDGSRDSTLNVLKENYDESLMVIINNKLNKGYGGAIKEGIKAAQTKYLITIDADAQHQLSDVLSLLNEIQDRDADMIVGSRKGIDAGFYRKMGKSIIRSLAKFLLPVHIYDINSGMKIYNVELAKKYIRLCPDSMAFSDIIAMVFISRRHLVFEKPILINPRTEGESTINTMTAIETIKEIINIVVLFNPMKVFFPIAIFSILSGLAWGLPIVIKGNGLSVGALLALVTGLIFFFFGLIAEQLSLIRKADIKE